MQLRAARTTAYPDETEITHRGAVRYRVALEMHNRGAVGQRKECVRGAEYASTDNDCSLTREVLIKVVEHR